MKLEDFLSFEIFFERHVKQFDSEDEMVRKNIKLKREHTCRVVKNSEIIGKYLNLSEKEMFIAKTIALFHDLGRFYQFAHYKTFDDSKSENHAELSVKVLEESGILNGISLLEKEMILKAVTYHNRHKVPLGESEKCLMFSRLVRDADKLDILGVLTNYYETIETDENPALEHFLPDDGTYNVLIIEDLLNHKNSNHEKVHTKYDQRLVTLTWIFDINFKISLEMIQNQNYIGKILKVLPENDDMSRVKEAIAYWIEGFREN